jgi:hypothetical protein
MSAKDAETKPTVKYTYDNYEGCTDCMKLFDTKERYEEDLGDCEEELDESRRELANAKTEGNDKARDNWEHDVQCLEEKLEELQEDLENIPKCPFECCINAICWDHAEVMGCDACESLACHGHLTQCCECKKLTCDKCIFFGKSTNVPKNNVLYHLGDGATYICDDCHSKHKCKRGRDESAAAPEADIAPKRTRPE